MGKYSTKIADFILNNNLFFVEILALAIPSVLFRHYTLDETGIQLLKNLLYILASLTGIRFLAPVIYQAYARDSKFVREKLANKICFYLKLLLLFSLLIVTTKILHSHLAPHTFSLLLIVLFLKIIVIRSLLENFTLGKKAAFRFLYILALCFLALLVSLELLVLPAFLIALSIACLLTGFSLSEFYQPDLKANAGTLRLPGILYILHAGLQSIYVVMQLVSSWHFLSLFFVPLIVKMTPAPSTQITPENLKKYSKLSIFVFVLFSGIMLFL